MDLGNVVARLKARAWDRQTKATSQIVRMTRFLSRSSAVPVGSSQWFVLSAGEKRSALRYRAVVTKMIVRSDRRKHRRV